MKFVLLVFFTGLVQMAVAQQAQQNYYNTLALMESQEDDLNKCDKRARALVTYYNQRKTEVADSIVQKDVFEKISYLADYDVHAACSVIMKITPDSLALKFNLMLTPLQKAAISKINKTHIRAYVEKKPVVYAEDIPKPGNGVKGSWASGTVAAELKKMIASSPTTVSKITNSEYTFEGYTHLGLANGKGKKTYNSGGYYEGNFLNGYYDGQGKLVFKNGDTYIGSFKAGKLHGYGVYINKDGGVQEGSWENGNYVTGTSKHKNPYLALPNAVSVSYLSGDYTGQMINGLAEGIGTMNYHNSAVYTGHWKNGLPHGQGKMKDPEGTEFTGIFDQGYFTKGRMFAFLSSVSNNVVVSLDESRMFVTKGWNNVAEKDPSTGRTIYKNMIQLSNGWNFSGDTWVEFYGVAEISQWKEYVGFTTVTSGGDPVEKKSTYGYYDPKKSANVVVTTTTKGTSASYSKSVPCQGCDVLGYRAIKVKTFDAGFRNKVYRAKMHDFVYKHYEEAKVKLKM